MTIEIRGMAPLLSVFDMPASLRFYRDVLGFAVMQDSGQGDGSGWVMLRCGNATIMLNTAYDDDERPEAPDGAAIAAHRDTCIYFSSPDVDAVYAYLKERIDGIALPEVAPYGMKQLYLLDPDGYNLYFQWPAS